VRIRDFVFGSGSEKELFKTLVSEWSKQFDLFPSLPFASIVDIEDSKLSPEERSFVFKTSVDYTLCTKQGQPLVSVEFDGMCHGFSKNGEYIQVLPSSKAPNRKRKLDLKLRLCQELFYPLLVVSYDEKNPIGKDMALTIVDGLIGQALAGRYRHELLEQMVEDSRGNFEHLPPHEQHEFLQDLVSDAGVAAELTWNPLAKKAAELEYTAWDKGLWKSHSVHFLCDPELPVDGDPLFNVETLRRRIEAFQHVRRMGCTVTVETPNGAVSETAWVRNFDGYVGVSPIGMAEDIASLIVAQRLLKK